MTQRLALLRRELFFITLAFAQAKPGITPVATVEPARFHPCFPAAHVLAVEDVNGPQAVAATVYCAVILFIIGTLLGIRVIKMGIDVTGIGAAFSYASHRDALVADRIMIMGALIPFTEVGARIEYHVARGTDRISLAIMVTSRETGRAN